MARAHGELPPPAKRAWGTGSVELRHRGYLARWRNEHGKQESKLFGTEEEANSYLDQMYPAGARLRRRSDVIGLVEHWRQVAQITTPPTSAPPEEDEQQRMSWMTRQATAQALTACSNDLGRLLGI